MKLGSCLPDLRRCCILLFLLSPFFCPSLRAQGGPPYYTNDPGTPGNLQWEINLGYMPFLFPNSSITHTPDLDINFGIGDRIQLTYEKCLASRGRSFSGEIRTRAGPIGIQMAIFGQQGFGIRHVAFPTGFNQ
jgi:hypothetical protein